MPTQPPRSLYLSQRKQLYRAPATGAHPPDGSHCPARLPPRQQCTEAPTPDQVSRQRTVGHHHGSSVRTSHCRESPFRRCRPAATSAPPPTQTAPTWLQPKPVALQRHRTDFSASHHDRQPNAYTTHPIADPHEPPRKVREHEGSIYRQRCRDTERQALATCR